MKTFRSFMNEKRINRIFEAYWISPTGLINGVRITHIQDIINNPEYFSTSTKDIKDYYKINKEKIGFEGKTRSEIMKVLLLKNWIRIRRRDNFYTIQTGELDETRRKYLKEFCSVMIEAGVHKNKDINFITTNEDIFKSFDEVQNDNILCGGEVLKYVEREKKN